MTIARHLATIDMLCSREFQAEHGRTDVGTAGPGYHVAALRTSEDFREDDGTEREAAEDQYEADRDGLAKRLTARYGDPQVFSLWSVLAHRTDGEDIPEPWGDLSSHVPNVPPVARGRPQDRTGCLPVGQVTAVPAPGVRHGDGPALTAARRGPALRPGPAPGRRDARPRPASNRARARLSPRPPRPAAGRTPPPSSPPSSGR